MRTPGYVPPIKDPQQADVASRREEVSYESLGCLKMHLMIHLNHLILECYISSIKSILDDSLVHCNVFRFRNTREEVVVNTCVVVDTGSSIPTTILACSTIAVVFAEKATEDTDLRSIIKKGERQDTSAVLERV